MEPFPSARGGGEAVLTDPAVLAFEDQLNAEIERLREQQRTIVRLLANSKRLRAARAIDKNGWVAILRAAGLDDVGMHRWHIEFERMAPKAHQDFLESLGLPAREVTRIRKGSRVAQGNTPRSG